MENISAVWTGLYSPTWASNQLIPSQYTRKERQAARAAPVYWADTNTRTLNQLEVLRLRETVTTGLRCPPGKEMR